MPANTEVHHHRETAHKLARMSLFGFLMTFILARVFVFLIMSKAMPNLYFFMGSTHVHHLNYGIFMLSAVAGYSVFRRPTRPCQMRPRRQSKPRARRWISKPANLPGIGC